MGVYIKGMEMPKDGNYCIIYDSGNCLMDEFDSEDRHIGSGSYSAYEINEPHGRLIDADVLKNDLTRFYENEVTARQLVDEQPTIIERSDT